MASNNSRKSNASETVVAEPEKPVATPAQEAFIQIVQLVHLRVPLTGPERDDLGRFIQLVAQALGMHPTT